MAGSKPRLTGDIGGACGDLGTLLPHVIGVIAVAGMAPLGILFGFGSFLVASGLFYGMPMAVQPMKAISAVLIAGELDAAGMAASGLIIGLVMLGLGATGAITPLARLIPQSVTTGLQLGLGLIMALLGLELMAEHPLFGAAILILLLALMRVRGLPAAPIVLVAAIGSGLALGYVAPPGDLAFGWALPTLVLPGWADMLYAVERAVIPQLPLTLTNAVIVTAILSRELYGAAAGRVSMRNLSLTTGLGNLLLAPLGGMPMCHGAGGVQAQYRFGARTGWAPVLLGGILLALALGFSQGAMALLGLIPMAAVGALLVVAGIDLALSRRLFDARAHCWPAIALTAGLTVLVNPAVALAAGWAVEAIAGGLRRYRAGRPSHRHTGRIR
ncbi:MAG: putative sulfate/molybdate transporter [Alphaproteobacteria bacterium]|nr:putative sulfate/molybdate transporter [Alphaproteobacteria bacterium]